MSLTRAAALAAALLVGAPATAGALPSGRTDYREPSDYGAELAALAAAQPDTVRLVRIGTSVEGRPIEGVEIAAQVARTDDGRPTHVELGLTHAREWPSGEVVMEFAHELATSSDPRLAALREGSRTFLFPLLNPDGFALSRTTVPHQRKNARGVDLNRNFGAYWGGPGASDNPFSDLYRGPEPFSEPEAQALRAWSSAHHVMVINSNHTFGRTVLHQPGFNSVDEPGLPAHSALPGRRRFAAVGARMAAAAGYSSQPAHAIYEVTGAVEDWNFFNQFAFAYTTEIGDEHQPAYATVAADYPRLREAMVLAGEAALVRRNHALLRGRAPAGSRLTMSRAFDSPTSYVLSGADGPSPVRGDARFLRERIATTLTVPESGRFAWHVNPSVRPATELAGRREAWRLRCGGERRRVRLRLGGVRRVRLDCRG